MNDGYGSPTPTPRGETPPPIRPIQPHRQPASMAPLIAQEQAGRFQEELDAGITDLERDPGNREFTDEQIRQNVIALAQRRSVQEEDFQIELDRLLRNYPEFANLFSLPKCPDENTQCDDVPLDPRCLGGMCETCTDAEDLITQDRIASGQGVCIDRKCYDITNLERWLKITPKLPHNQQRYTVADLNKAKHLKLCKSKKQKKGGKIKKRKSKRQTYKQYGGFNRYVSLPFGAYVPTLPRWAGFIYNAMNENRELQTSNANIERLEQEARRTGTEIDKKRVSDMRDYHERLKERILRKLEDEALSNEYLYVVHDSVPRQFNDLADNLARKRAQRVRSSLDEEKQELLPIRRRWQENYQRLVDAEEAMEQEERMLEREIVPENHVPRNPCDPTKDCKDDVDVPCLGGLCTSCEGDDDPILLEEITEGQGVCIDKQCYDIESLRTWLRNKPILPHNKRPYTLAELNRVVDERHKLNCDIDAERQRRLEDKKAEEDRLAVDAKAKGPPPGWRRKRKREGGKKTKRTSRKRKSKRQTRKTKGAMGKRISAPDLYDRDKIKILQRRLAAMSQTNPTSFARSRRHLPDYRHFQPISKTKSWFGRRRNMKGGLKKTRKRRGGGDYDTWSGSFPITQEEVFPEFFEEEATAAAEWNMARKEEERIKAEEAAKKKGVADWWKEWHGPLKGRMKQANTRKRKRDGGKTKRKRKSGKH